MSAAASAAAAAAAAASVVDASGVKARVEARLRLEEESVRWLEDRTKQSQELAVGMVSILASFEDRLARLEATILPVYLETETLQRRQDNIDRTLDALDGVIGFYNVSKETEPIIRAGPLASSGGSSSVPGGASASSISGAPTGLQPFLQAMSRLKGALDYFQANNPASIELENVRTLYEVGEDTLSREFGETVKVHSKAVDPEDLMSSLTSAEQLTGGPLLKQGFPEEVQSGLVAASEWLNMNERDDFLTVYTMVRGATLKKSLENFQRYLAAHHAATATDGSPAGVLGGRSSPATKKNLVGSSNATTLSSSPSSPSIASYFGMSGSQVGSDTSPSSAAIALAGKKHSARLLHNTLNRKLGHKVLDAMYLGSQRGGGGGGGGGYASGSGSHVYVPPEDQVLTAEANHFCLMVSALQKLMAVEKDLMVGIVPQPSQRHLFESLTRSSLDLVIREAESIISRARKAVANSDFQTIMNVFAIVKHLTGGGGGSGLKVAMDRTLEGCEAALRTKYNGMVNSFYGAGSMALDGFVDNIRSDNTTRERMPKDGTVFQLTSNVLLFLEQLSEFADTVASVLTQQDSSYNQQLLSLPRNILVSERSSALLGIYIKKVLVQLNLTLVNKSDSYPDPFLKAVFRLNNNQYILRSLQRSGLMDLVSLAKQDCAEDYEDMILEQKRMYSQSWGRVLTHIWSADSDIPAAVLHAPGKLADKYCRMVKDKFAGFNKEMEEIATTQRSYSIPDLELRESLKRDNKEYICPKYNSFYEKYANVQFTKNPDKYIKYTPAEVSALIDSFFDAAA